MFASLQARGIAKSSWIFTLSTGTGRISNWVDRRTEHWLKTKKVKVHQYMEAEMQKPCLNAYYAGMTHTSKRKRRMNSQEIHP